MTRRELKEHCATRQKCAGCEYQPELTRTCIVECDGKAIPVWEWPERILDNKLYTDYDRKVARQGRMFHGALIGMLIGVILGAALGYALVVLSHGTA